MRRPRPSLLSTEGWLVILSGSAAVALASVVAAVLRR